MRLFDFFSQIIFLERSQLNVVVIYEKSFFFLFFLKKRVLRKYESCFRLWKHSPLAMNNACFHLHEPDFPGSIFFISLQKNQNISDKANSWKHGVLTNPCENIIKQYIFGESVSISSPRGHSNQQKNINIIIKRSFLQPALPSSSLSTTYSPSSVSLSSSKTSSWILTRFRTSS